MNLKMLQPYEFEFHERTRCTYRCRNYKTCKRYITLKGYATEAIFACSPMEEDGKCYYHSLLGSYKN